MPPLPEEGSRLKLRVVENLIEGLDLGAGNARLLEQRYPVSPRLVRRHLFDHRDQDVPTRMTRGVVLETLLARPFRVTHRIAERPPVPCSRGAATAVSVHPADPHIRP